MTIFRTQSSITWSDEDVQSTGSFCATRNGSLDASLVNAPRPRAGRRNDPYAVVTQTYRKEPAGVVLGVSHQPLIGSCFYLPIPKIRQVLRKPVAVPDAAVQLQIRQVRFEIETGQIRWLVRRLTSVHVIKAEQVAPGVVTIWVRNPTDADRVCNLLHQNILFDFQGVFAPLNREQHDALVSYVDTRQFHTRSQRLPREPMTVNRMYAPPPPPPPPLAPRNSDQLFRSDIPLVMLHPRMTRA